MAYIQIDPVHNPLVISVFTQPATVKVPLPPPTNNKFVLENLVDFFVTETGNNNFVTET